MRNPRLLFRQLDSKVIAQECRELPPFLQISHGEKPYDQPQEWTVNDFLAQNGQKDSMIDSLETLTNVSLNEPDCSPPVVVNLSQRGMTPSTSPKPVRVVAELRFV